jgi:ankyrin repeat protein
MRKRTHKAAECCLLTKIFYLKSFTMKLYIETTKLYLSELAILNQEIDVEDTITSHKLHVLINQLTNEAGSITTIVVDSFSCRELETLATIMLETGLNFRLPALANTDFYLNILEGWGVNLTSLSFTDTTTTVPVIPFVSPAPVFPSVPRRLSTAIEYSDFNQVQLILTENPELVTLLTETNETLLHLAVKSNARILKLLLSLGADAALRNKKGMLPANIAVRDKMPREIVLPLLKWNFILYNFFYAFYFPERIYLLHSKAVDTSEFPTMPETFEIIHFLIQSEIFPSTLEKNILSEPQKLQNILSLAIEKSEWLIATTYVQSGFFDINSSDKLDLIVKSKNMCLFAESVPYINNEHLFSNYQLPTLTLTDNSTNYFEKLLLLFLVTGFNLTDIKKLSGNHPLLREKIDQPLPILFSEARKIYSEDNRSLFDKYFRGVVNLSGQNIKLKILEEIDKTLVENTDITKIQFTRCRLEPKFGEILDSADPQPKELIQNIFFSLYLNNFNSLRKLASIFLQWGIKFGQEENLTQRELIINELESMVSAVGKISDALSNDTNRSLLSLLLMWDKLIVCIKQLFGLNYALAYPNPKQSSLADLSSLTAEDLEIYYDSLSKAETKISPKSLLGLTLKDRLRKIVNKLKAHLEKRKEEANLLDTHDFFDLAISLIKTDYSMTLYRYLGLGKITIQTRDSDNNTLIHHAVACGAKQTTIMLLKTPGCELDAINNHGETPFFLLMKSQPDNCYHIMHSLLPALRKSNIDPHANWKNPVTIQNTQQADYLLTKGVSLWSGRDLQNRALYAFDLPYFDLPIKSHLSCEKSSEDGIFSHTLNLEGKKFTLEQFQELVQILEKFNFIRINLSECSLLEITELESNEILDIIIRRLFLQQCNQGLTLTQNLPLDQLITSIISIIETLKNEIDKPDISSLSLFNNIQDQILELFHLFKTFGDVLKAQNRDLFTEQVIRRLQELSELFTSTPHLQNFPVFPILQTSCSELNKSIIELLSSLGLLESTFTDLPEETISALETAILSEKTLIGDSSPSDPTLSSSDVTFSKNIPEDIHAIHEKKYVISLLSDLKKIEMALLPKIDKMENYINADRKKAEDAIVNLQAELSNILGKIEGLNEKSALIKIGMALKKKVDYYCTYMMGLNAYNVPHFFYCEIRSLAEQFNTEWEKILSAKTVSIPEYSQNPAAFLPSPASQPSANSISSPQACAQLSWYNKSR